MSCGCLAEQLLLEQLHAACLSAVCGYACGEFCCLSWCSACVSCKPFCPIPGLSKNFLQKKEAQWRSMIGVLGKVLIRRRACVRQVRGSLRQRFKFLAICAILFMSHRSTRCVRMRAKCDTLSSARTARSSCKASALLLSPSAFRCLCGAWAGQSSLFCAAQARHSFADDKWKASRLRGIEITTSVCAKR